MAPIRRFKRRQQPQQKKDAEMGFEALSLLEGKVPAGDGESSKPAAAQAEIRLEVEPGALFRFEALSLLSGKAPTVDVATTPQPERAKGDAASASESSNPPLKPTSSVTQAEMGLKRVEQESEPTKHRLPPTADDVEVLREKNRQPPSPPVFEIPPVRGGSPGMSGGSTDPSPLPTQDQETDRLLKQIDDALHRVMEIRRCKMQEDLEADSLLEKSRGALKRVMAIRGGRSDADESVKPSSWLSQEEIDRFGKNCGNLDDEILRLKDELEANQSSALPDLEEVHRFAKKFDIVEREMDQARAAAQESKSTATVIALRSALDKGVKFDQEHRNFVRTQADEVLSRVRIERDLVMALTVKEATPVAGAVGLKRYPLLSAKLAEHLAEEEREMLERCCLQMDAAELQTLNDDFLKCEIAWLKAKYDKEKTSLAGEEAVQTFCLMVINEIKKRLEMWKQFIWLEKQ